MGVMVHTGFLDENKKLTPEAKDMFIREVKELVIYGSENLPNPTPFKCGDPLPPAGPQMTMETFKLEDPNLYNSFHVDIIQNRYEKFLVMLDTEPTFSLLPTLADPIALAGKAFSVNLPPIPFPTGFLPYFSGLLVPKLFVDLAKRGVKDFLTPADLAKKLVELASVPKPPVPVPLVPVPTPAIPDVPDLPPPPPVPLPEGSLELPPVDIAVTPPQIAYSEVLTRDISALIGIPQFIAQLVSKIPTLAPKFGDLSSIFSELCGLARDSGIFPQSDSNNSIEKAVNVVFSRRLAEAALVTSMSMTLGSSNGSAVSSIGKDPIGLKPPEPPTPTPPAATPNEIVYQFANKCINLSYGKNEQVYSAMLFYYESCMATAMPGTINAFGEPYPSDIVGNQLPGTLKPPEPGMTRYILSKRQDLWGITGVTNPTGFIKYVNWAARDASSCAIFGRACYFNAGVVNRFFNDVYPPSTCLAGIQIIGMLKNYRWLLEDYSYNEELERISRTVGVPRPGLKITDPAKFIDQWSIIMDAQGGISSKTAELTPHLKSLDKLACFDESLLRDMAINGMEFPEIEQGDLMMTQLVTSNDVKIGGREHMLVTMRLGKTQLKLKESRPDGKMWVLDTPIDIVHGGQPDSYNTTEKDEKNAPEPDLPWLTPLLSKLAGGGSAPPEAVKPTAIRAGTMNLGYVQRQGVNAGFYLTSSAQVTEDGTIGDASPQDEAINPPNGKRKIIAFFRTRNYADQIENGEVSSIQDADARSRALSSVSRATNTIDAHPLMLWVMSILRDPKRMENIVKVTFRNLPSGQQ